MDKIIKLNTRNFIATIVATPIVIGLINKFAFDVSNVNLAYLLDGYVVAVMSVFILKQK